MLLIEVREWSVEHKRAGLRLAINPAYIVFFTEDIASGKTLVVLNANNGQGKSSWYLIDTTYENFKHMVDTRITFTGATAGTAVGDKTIPTF